MLYGGDGPGPVLTAAHTNGWKKEDTDRNNCLSLLIVLCVGLADNCTFIFTILPNILIHYTKKVLDPVY